MPPQKRARSEPAEPAPELTTSATAAKKVSMTATLDAMPHCRSKAEVIAAVESHLVPSALNEGEMTRLEVSRFPEKYRKYLNKATASLSAEPPTYAMMNFVGGKNAWAFHAGGPDSDPLIQFTLSICALAPTSSSRRLSSRASRSAARD